MGHATRIRAAGKRLGVTPMSGERDLTVPADLWSRLRCFARGAKRADAVLDYETAHAEEDAAAETLILELARHGPSPWAEYAQFLVRARRNARGTGSRRWAA